MYNITFFSAILIYHTIFNKIGQWKLWQRIFQPPIQPNKKHDSDLQLKTDKRAVDLYKKIELGRNNAKNGAYELWAINLEHYIQNILSQRYPEPLGYKKGIAKAVTNVLRQVIY